MKGWFLLFASALLQISLASPSEAGVVTAIPFYSIENYYHSSDGQIFNGSILGPTLLAYEASSNAKSYPDSTAVAVSSQADIIEFVSTPGASIDRITLGKQNREELTSSTVLAQPALLTTLGKIRAIEAAYADIMSSPVFERADKSLANYDLIVFTATKGRSLGNLVVGFLHHNVNKQKNSILGCVGSDGAANVYYTVAPASHAVTREPCG